MKFTVYNAYGVDFTQFDSFQPVPTKYADDKHIDIYAKDYEQPIDKNDVIVTPLISKVGVRIIKKEMDKVAYNAGLEQKVKELMTEFPELDEEEIKHIKPYKTFKKSLKKQLMDTARNVVKTFGVFHVQKFFENGDDAVIFECDNEDTISKVKERMSEVCKGFDIEGNIFNDKMNMETVTELVNTLNNPDTVFCGPVVFTSANEGGADTVTIAGLEALGTDESKLAFENKRQVKKISLTHKFHRGSDTIIANIGLNSDKASFVLKSYQVIPEDNKQDDTEEMIETVKNSVNTIYKLF